MSSPFGEKTLSVLFCLQFATLCVAGHLSSSPSFPPPTLVTHTSTSTRDIFRWFGAGSPVAYGSPLRQRQHRACSILLHHCFSCFVCLFVWFCLFKTLCSKMELTFWVHLLFFFHFFGPLVILAIPSLLAIASLHQYFYFIFITTVWFPFKWNVFFLFAWFLWPFDWAPSLVASCCLLFSAFC